jgi:hypothetical protein
MVPKTGPVSPSCASELLDDLGDHADRLGFGSLGSHHQLILLAWAGRGIIGNGGFRHWYEGKGADDTRALARAFRALGCPDVAEACESSLSVVPDGHPRGCTPITLLRTLEHYLE